MSPLDNLFESALFPRSRMSGGYVRAVLICNDEYYFGVRNGQYAVRDLVE